MHITIDNASQFRDHFAAMGRKDQFSYEALGLLFEHCGDMEEELDVIALCCDYSEDIPEDVARNYELEDGQDPFNYLNGVTEVIGVTSTGSIVYAQF